MKIVHAIPFLVFCCTIIPLAAFTPGKRAQIADLTKALERNSVTAEDARTQAIALHITGSDLRDASVAKLITLADSKGIPDILNPALAPKKAPAQELIAPTIATETIMDTIEPRILFTLQDSTDPASVPLFIHEFIGRLNNYPYTEAEATALRARTMENSSTKNPYAGKTAAIIMREVEPLLMKIRNQETQWDTQSLIDTYYQLILARVALKEMKYKGKMTQTIYQLLRKYRKDAQSEPLYVAEMIEDFEREQKTDDARENRFKR